MPRHEEGYFTTPDGLKLFWRTDAPEAAPRAHVGVIHGYADHCGRFHGIIDHLVAQGFFVHAFDYRGHGQSDGRRGHCESFSQFVGDVDAFWQRVLEKAGSAPAFVLSHSNGGLITLHWMQKRQWVRGFVFSSPYLRLALKPPGLQILAAKVIGKVVPWVPFKLPLLPEQLSRDPQAQAEVAKDSLYNHVVTPRYFSESTRAQDEVPGLGPSVVAPCLFFCGSADPIASSEATRQFFERVGAADKTFKEYPGMVHECMNDVGKEQVWSDISGWISAHL